MKRHINVKKSSLHYIWEKFLADTVSDIILIVGHHQCDIYTWVQINISDTFSLICIILELIV